MNGLRRAGLQSMLTWSLLAAGSCGLCSDTVGFRVKSPDGKLTAYVFERDCGATTDFAPHVNLQAASEEFNGDAGILFVVKGKHDISAAWTSERTLVVTCPTCAKEVVFRQVSKLGDTEVKYNLAADSR